MLDVTIWRGVVKTGADCPFLIHQVSQYT